MTPLPDLPGQEWREHDGLVVGLGLGLFAFFQLVLWYLVVRGGPPG